MMVPLSNWFLLMFTAKCNLNSIVQIKWKSQYLSQKLKIVEQSKIGRWTSKAWKMGSIIALFLCLKRSLRNQVKIKARYYWEEKATSFFRYRIHMLKTEKVEIICKVCPRGISCFSNNFIDFNNFFNFKSRIQRHEINRLPWIINWLIVLRRQVPI